MTTRIHDLLDLPEGVRKGDFVPDHPPHHRVPLSFALLNSAPNASSRLLGR